MTKKRTALYLRVSKADDSQSPTNQLEPLLKMAESLDLEVVAKYVDMASGGSANRPQFQQMLNDANKRKFDMILVWSMDRFSRSGILSSMSYLEILKRAGVAIKSLQEPLIDTTIGGAGELIIAVLAWVAEQERQRISERTKAGLATAVANGKKLGRPNGSKDKGRRKRSGYINRWLTANA